MGNASLVLAGAAVGIVATLFVRHSGGLTSHPQGQEPVTAAPQAISSSPVTASAEVLRVDSTAQSRSEPAPGGTGQASKPLPTREEMAHAIEAFGKIIEDAQTRQLLGAGFAKERIDWIHQIHADLKQAREEASKENKLNGIRDPFELAYKADVNLELRHVLAEDEFIRYRQALGQPTEVEVTEVHEGSGAQAAGIVPGDYIIRYGGTRVFNYYEMNALAEETTEASVVVEVRRNGQILSFSLPKGLTGIRGPMVAGNMYIP